MIRLKKSEDIPSSLHTTSCYDGENVKKQLLADQQSKCYLCERALITDFEMEHFKSQRQYPELIQDWDNLLLACGYCNRKKSNSFNEIVNPLTTNVEDEISQRLDFANKKAVFTTFVEDKEHTNTLSLLNLIFNGKRKFRNIREEKFFDHVMSILNAFLKIIDNYLQQPDETKAELVRCELAIDKELLGFKYWIIKDNPILMEAFHQDIVWNKQLKI